MKQRLLLILLAATLAIAISGSTLAQGVGPAIARWVIGGGGGPASGGSFALDGTLGQPIAGPSSGGAYTLNAGYWQEDARAPSTVVFTSSANPSLAGGPLTLTVVVTGSATTPTGLVTFKNGAATLGTAALDASGEATFDASALPAGTHQLTAVYSGDVTYLGSTSETLAQVVQLRATKTAIDAPAVTYNAAATVVVTVSSPHGTPTGNVSLSVDGGAAQMSALDAAGKATCTLPGLAVGDHALAASYAAQGHYDGSSATATLRVNLASTAVSLSSSCNPAAPGDRVTFTAQVTALPPGGGVPAGTVSFQENGTELGTATLDASGLAAWATTALTAGTHEIAAVYAGNESYLGSISGPLVQTIGFRATTTAIDATSTNVVVTVSSPPAVPTGAVTLTVDGGTPLTAELTPAAVQSPPTARATFDLSALGAGDHALVASYARQGLFEASSASGTLHINAAPQASADPASFTTPEDTPRAGLRFSVVDADAGDANSLRFTLAAAHGRLALATTAGLTGLAGTNGTAYMAYGGTLAAINAALDGVTYTPDADYSGADTITLTIDDGGASGVGGAKGASLTVAVNIDAANDAPVLTVPGAQACDVTGVTFAAANGNRIHMGDVDAGGDPLQVAFSVAHGALRLASTDGLSFTVGDGSDDTSMAFIGSLAAINAALDGLKFLPEPLYTGNDTLQVAVDDQGHNGAGGSLSASATVSITVSSVPLGNPPPLNVVPGPQTTAEDTPVVFSAANGNLVAVNDMPGDLLEVRLHVAHGTLTLATTAGLTFLPPSADGTGDMTFSGAPAAVNAALDGLRYTPSADYAGADTLSITSRDSNAASDSDSLAISIRAVNDAPAVGGLADVTFTEDGGAVSVAAGISVQDVDSPVLVRASVWLDARPDGSAETLSVDTAGTSITATPVAGGLGLLLQGAATPAEYRQVLRTLRYNNASQAPDTSARTLTVAVDDGAASDGAACTLIIAAVNDAPALSTVSDLTGAVEDTPFTIDHYTLANAADEADADDATVGFRIEGVLAGTLSKGGAPAGAGTTLAPGESIAWTPPADAYGTLEAFTIVAWDGAAPSASPVRVRVVVAAANDVPVLAPAGPALPSITEDDTGGAGTLVSAIVGDTISDIDEGALEGIAIYAMTAENGAWQYSTDGGTTWQDVLSPSQAQALLLVPASRLRFRPDGNNGGTSTLSYYAWDQTTGSAGATADATSRGGTTAFSTAGDTVSITVASLNDVPVVTDVSKAGTEDTPLALAAADFDAGFTDVDTGDSLQAVRIASLPAHGTLRLDGAAVTAGEEVVRADLGKLAFTPDANWNGTTSFSWNGSDGTAYAATGASFTITIGAVDDPPTLTTVADLAGAVEDMPYTITYETLAAAADEADIDSATLWFRIEAVTSGTLSKGGVPAGAGTLFGPGESLVWAPPADANGTIEAFRVVAWDGNLASSPPVPVRVVVRAINDAPVVSLAAGATIDEGGALTESGTFSDPDSSAWTATVDYGDGSGVQLLALAVDKTFTLSHTYAQSGDYTVTVEISDGQAIGSAVLALTVRNVAPALTGQFDQIANEGTLTSFNLGSFGDPGTDNPWQVRVDWGDGSGETTFSSQSSGGLAPQAHRYDDNGTYTVRITVRDRDGASGSGTFRAIVRNVAPSVGIEAHLWPTNAGMQVGLWAHVSDASAADSAAGFSYQWSLKRNGVEIGCGWADSLGFTIPFDAPGTYLASLDVKDKDGGIASTSWHTVQAVQRPVDARIQILWPHGGAPVSKASLANLSVWLLEPGTLRPAALTGDPIVYLWRAVNNEPAQIVATGTRRGLTALCDFNNVDVSAARDPRNRVLFYVTVAGVPTRSNVWVRAQDGRTWFPVQDLPTAAGYTGSPLDARIEILWPHGGAPVFRAAKANLTAILTRPGTLESVSPDWSPTVRLWRALDNGVMEEVAVGAKRVVTRGGLTYPVWDFNNVDVSAAKDPAHKLIFMLTVDGVETRSNVWVHGVDARTIFPVWDVVQ